MKKATATIFETVLNTLVERGIATKDALMADQQLYTNFWLAAQDFSHFALLSKGNRTKIAILESRGITTREDVIMDCVARIVEYTDRILSKPTIAYMKNYTYATVNTVVDTICRSIPPIEFVPWDTPINSDTNEDGVRLCDSIGDDRYDPERLYCERERIAELEKQLQEKRAKELVEKRTAILRGIATLSEYPGELMVWLGIVHNGMKPRELTSLIIDKGCEVAFAEVIYSVAKKNRINLIEIRNLIADNMVSAESVKADTNNPKAISDQISRLKYRADKKTDKGINKRTDKHPPK